MEYKLWGTGGGWDSEENEEALGEKQEDRPQSSNGAYPSNSSSSANGQSDADSTVWATDAPDSDEYEGGNALSRGNARFWAFRRDDAVEQQAGSEDRSYSSSSGWTVLEPGKTALLAVHLDAVDSNNVTEQESIRTELQVDSASGDRARLAGEDGSFVVDKTAAFNAAAAASAGPLSDVEHRQSPASSSGQQNESAGEALQHFNGTHACGVFLSTASQLSRCVLVTREQGEEVSRTDGSTGHYPGVFEQGCIPLLPRLPGCLATGTAKHSGR